MIITKSSPFTIEETEKLKEQFDSYIKTVIDINRKVCCAGMDKHLDQKLIIESLAMDLKRFAVGLHRGSFGMAGRFKEDALMLSTLFQNFAIKNF